MSRRLPPVTSRLLAIARTQDEGATATELSTELAHIAASAVIAVVLRLTLGAVAVGAAVTLVALWIGGAL